MNDPGALPDGFSVDAVDWLPSGARSGLVRVRGHRPAAVSGPLPELILEAGGESRRYVSLPDPRADRDPTAWRGAYVLEAQPAAEADRLWLEWPGARRIALPPLSVPEHQVAQSAAAGPAPSFDEVVVDRAVLAERRARRAEASEQAQTRIAREAMRAVEVLELRANELEQRALEAEGERDAFRGQSVEPDVRAEVLTAEIRELRVTLDQREAEIERRMEAVAAPVARGDADRRAERLRSALTATVATVGELRLRLHELQVARRTVDVAAAADAVRLAVFERERAGLAAEAESSRARLRDALGARDEAAAALEGVRGAHEELRTQFADVSAELGSARARIAELESEIAAVTAVAERSSQEARDAARAEAAALAAEHAHDSERELDALRARLEAAEAAIEEAETARELAEAGALAAATQRQAAAVAHAARGVTRPGAPAGKSSPGGRSDDTFATRSVAPRVPEALIAAAAAAEAERASAERRGTEESDRIVADLETAAAALRASEPTVPEPEGSTEPSGPVEPEAAPERTSPQITFPSTDPPADLARGRSTREYPPLRGALVKLAHDDPAAAGRILAGLLKAQLAVTDAPPDYDLTIAEVGTFAVSAAGQTTLVSPLDAPRGRGQAAFHLQTDALTFAETVAGVEARPRRRRGALRASGKVRAARRLTESLRADASLADLVAAGADLDPGLVLRGFAYAVRPAWTQGQNWSVELHVDGRPLAVVARHAGGLAVTDGPHDGEPDARLRLSANAFRDLVTGTGAPPAGEGDARVLARLLALAERARTGAD